MSKRVETDTFRVFHAGFHQREATGDQIQMPRGFMLKSKQVGSELAKRRLDLADFDTGAADIGVQLFQISQSLFQILLNTIDIAAEENALGAGLADGGLELKNPGLELVHIGPQRCHVEVNTVENGAMGIEFTADVFILAIPTVDIAVFRQDSGS